MKRPIVAIALLHVAPAEQMALRSAVSSISMAGLLPATVVWGKVDDAEILIADVDQAETVPTLTALCAERPRAVLRYSGQRGSDAAVTRPIRGQALTAELVRAVAEALAQSALLPSATARGVQALRYRGGEVEREASTSTAPNSGAATKARFYRGQPY